MSVGVDARLGVVRLWLYRQLKASVYPVFAGALVLLTARWFYGHMLHDTGGEWSAPLDDVFIHFDFARSTARGYPFQWSEGNGYSSGNTSLSYPFVLAAGYWIGFRGPALMIWAAVVACYSVFAWLLVAPRMADGMPGRVKYLFPVATLCVGALNWSFFSGMEVAWFLGVWALAVYALWRFRRIDDESFAKKQAGAGWWLGLASALMVATRPEAASCAAVLGLAAGWFVWKRTAPANSDAPRTPVRKRYLGAIATVLRAGIPPVLLLVVQSIANYVLTGDTAAAGALTKLAVYHPYMSTVDKWNEYIFHLGYVFGRNFHYHFSSIPPTGWLPVPLMLIALGSRKTRTSAVILVASAVTFLMLVAMNGHVRWQNERYTMPAVAMLLLAAALGVAVLLDRAFSSKPAASTAGRVLCGVLAVGAVVAFGVGQYARYVDQVFFFARASRNIRDQHTTVGRLLRSNVNPVPNRVLVGDAGAITYAADIPGLDIIGLGGYHRLPFARASSNGLGAVVELLEHLSDGELPDVMAIYPSWWGMLPVMFGRYMTAVPVEDNVICGGPEKVIYATNWRYLNTGNHPATLLPGERVVDWVDIADVLSEREHSYNFTHPHAGWVHLRLLSDPVKPTEDVLDAGRDIAIGREESFVLTSNTTSPNARLIVRASPVASGEIEVFVDGRPSGTLRPQPTDHWQELSLPLASPVAEGQKLRVRMHNKSVFGWINYHVWLVTSP